MAVRSLSGTGRVCLSRYLVSSDAQLGFVFVSASRVVAGRGAGRCKPETVECERPKAKIAFSRVINIAKKGRCVNQSYSQVAGSFCSEICRW